MYMQDFGKVGLLQITVQTSLLLSVLLMWPLNFTNTCSDEDCPKVLKKWEMETLSLFSLSGLT